jgi:hypothetical protein
MDTYRPVSTANFLWRRRPQRPNRRQLLTLMNNYDEIAGLIVLGILILTVAPLIRHEPAFLLWPAIYLAYRGLKYLLPHVVRAAQRWLFSDEPLAARLRTARGRVIPGWVTTLAAGINAREAMRRAQLVAAATLIVGALAFDVAVQRASDTIGSRFEDDTMVWLLFALPLLRVARWGSWKWVIGLTAMAIVCNALAQLLGASVSGLHAAQLIAVQSAWLALICLLPTLLASYLADCGAELEMAVRLSGQIAGLSRLSPSEVAARATKIIAEELDYDEVNILVPTSEDDAAGLGLRFLGAASEAGKELVTSGDPLDHARGVTGATAVERREHIVNDVDRDTRGLYMRHDRFQDTQAEYALPLALEDTLVGVLDIQTKRRFAFGENDAETLRAVASHLTVCLDNARNLADARGLAEISQTVGRRLLSHHEMRGVLREVVRVAREVLEADLVALYPRNPRDGSFGDPLLDGEVLGGHIASGEAVSDPDRPSAVQRALRLGAAQFIDRGASHSDVMRASRGAHDARPSFVDREGIQATAILPLRLGSEAREGHVATHGIIFVNYRKRRLFSRAYREWCEALGDLAALAIQNTLLDQRVANEERANVWRELHDGMQQYAAMGRMLIEQVDDAYRRTGTLTEIDGKRLAAGCDGVQRLQRELNYLVEVWRDRDPYNAWRVHGDVDDLARDGRSFFGELHAYADIVEKALEIRCRRELSGDDGAIPPAVQYDARMILREAVHNAYRHGGARSITLSARVSPGTLILRIEDDGKGLGAGPPSTGHGLDNMRRRAQRHGGRPEDPVIEPLAPSGTVVTVSLHWVEGVSTSASGSHPEPSELRLPAD